MQHVKIDPATQHALVGGGALLGKLTESLHEQGGRAFAHGICPGVGIGGHATIVSGIIMHAKCDMPTYLGATASPAS